MYTQYEQGANPSGGRTILVVSGDSNLRAELTKIISPAYRALRAEDGAGALDMLRRERVDGAMVVLSPGGEGLSLIKAISADPAAARTPCVAVASQGGEKGLGDALDAGARDVILCPCDPRVLLNRLANVLDLSAAVSVLQRTQRARDGLTQLYSRAAFIELAQQTLSATPLEKYVVTAVDVDGFKLINDRFGHDEGDRLLRYIASALKDAYADLSPLFARDTGDVFFALLPNRPKALDAAAQKFFDAVRDYDLPYCVNTHIGRYAVDETGMDVGLMIDRALMAVRSIKGSANLRVAWFDTAIRDMLLLEQEMTNDMRPALEKGQFVLFFQPQYNFATRQMTGAEALVRWNHPVRGVLPPSRFIPLFEKNGFITELDEYVWERTCRDLRKWLDDGLKCVPVSVNISRRDIRSADICKVLVDLVRKYDLTPGMLHLEITESAYIDQPAELIRTVERLQKAGFEVEMDDFGSGYSSLNTLKDLPVDILKLDLKFVRDGESATREGGILSSVMRMAHWLRMPVIAEGVESVHYARYLKSIGCYVMQGFYFAPPMPEDEFEALLSNSGLGAPGEAGREDVRGAAEFLDASAQSTVLFDSFAAGAQIVEFDGSRLESIRVNDQFYRIIDETPQEYAAASPDLLERFTLKSRSTFVSALQEASTTGDEISCELLVNPTVRHPDGIWVLAHIRYLEQNQGRRTYSLSVDGMAPSRELERLVNNVPVGLYGGELDDGLHLTYISEPLRDMMGPDAPSTDAGGNREYASAIFEADRPAYYKALKELEEAPGMRSLEYRLISRQRARTWVRDTLRSVQGEHGMVACCAVRPIDWEQDALFRLQTLTDAVPSGICMFGYSQGKLTLDYFNDAVCRISGYSREEYQALADRDALALVHREDLPCVMRVALKLFKAGQSTADCEFRVVTRSGPRWLRMTARQASREGTRKRVYVVLSDINERKIAQAQLAFRTACLEAMDSALSAGTIIRSLDDNRSMLYVSPNIQRLLGYSAQTFNRMCDANFSGLIHPEDVQRVLEATVRFAESQPATYEMEFRFIRRDGSPLWVLEKATLLPDFEGNVAYLCVFMDISRQITVLRENEQLMRIMARQSQQILVLYDFETDTLKPYNQMDGAPVSAMLLHRHPMEFLEKGGIAPESVAEFREKYAALREGRLEGQTRIRAKGMDGGWHWLNISVSTLYGEAGQPTHAIVSMKDVTELHEKEVAFQRYENLMAASSPNQLFYLDYDLTRDTLEGHSAEVEPPELMESARQGFNACMQKMRDRLVYEPDREAFGHMFSRGKLMRAFAGGATNDSMEFRLRYPGAEAPFYARASYQMISDPYTLDMRLLFSCQTIDEKKRAELQLISRAQNDAVTGLYNRATFIEMLRERLQKAKPDLLYAFAMLDVDGFKRVNDTFGHLAGDIVLHDVARTARSLLFRGDLVGRLGGDEFGLFFGDFPSMDVLEEKLHLLVTAIYRNLGKGVIISASVGVAQYAQDGDSFEQLYQKADVALYRAKRGRNQYMFYSADMELSAGQSMLTPIDGAARDDTREDDT